MAASRRQLVESHIQDSVRQVNEQTTTAKWAEIQNLKNAEIMLATAYSKQQALVQAGAQANLCINLYNRLRVAYEATSGITKLAKAQRLRALMTLTESLHRGEQPELNKSIRKENDLNKVLALH